MKKIILFFYLVTGYQVFAQIPGVPDSINYQAVLRDGAGEVLAPGTFGTLNFRIYSDLISANPDYEENHTFTTNAVGLVNLYIGGGSKVGSNTMANVNWAGGTASYEVRLNGSLIGSRQAFASVPYALYARSAGGSLPSGSQNQTLYNDGGQWKATSNLSNDGTRLSIGTATPLPRIKLNVFSNDALDSSAVFGTKLSAVSGDAAFRGVVVGSSNFSALVPGIFGLDARAKDLGNGYGIGVSGQAETTNGIAIGVSAKAQGVPSATIMGLYASSDTLQNHYSAVFDKGKILFGGRQYFGDQHSLNALPGWVYHIDAQKRGYWAPIAVSNSTVNLIQNGIISVTTGTAANTFTIGAQPPTFNSVGVGSIIPGPYPSYTLNVPPPSLSVNGNSITVTQGSSSSTQTISLLSSSSGTAGYIPFYTSPTSFSTSNIFKSAANSIGVNTSNPNTFFHLFKPFGSDTVLFESPVGASVAYALKNVNRRYAMTLNGIVLKFEENGVDRMVFLNGNVGIGQAVPLEKFEVAGTSKIATDTKVTGFVSQFENSIPTLGQSSGVVHVLNTGARSLTHKAMQIDNTTTKVGGSGTSKIGLEIQSTGSWAPSTNQPNIGILSNVSGATNGFNYSALFTGGQVGINNTAPKSTLSVFGGLAVKKVTTANSYNMTADDYILECSAPIAVTIQLPPSASVDEGALVVVRSVTNSSHVIQGFGGDVILPVGNTITVPSVLMTPAGVKRFYKSGNIWVEM